MACCKRLIALILGGIAHHSFATPLVDSAPEALLEVLINGEKQPMWSLVKISVDDSPWVSRSDLQSWGVQLAADNAVNLLAPGTMIALNEVPGVHATIDRPASILKVEVQPALLNSHAYRLEVVDPKPIPSPLGAFLNYDVGGGRFAGSSNLRALSEIGVVQGNMIVRSSSAATVDDGHAINLRLDSNVTLDFPSRRISLQLGDTFAQLGTNADVVRIAGISWGTDFSLTPTFITAPLPTVNSVTATASTVELYVNGAKTQQLSVPGGPFSVAGVPVTTGPGELTVVTHDLLGHTQSFTQSYYIAPQMLQAGLSAWDFQLGTKRQQYGAQSNLYSGWLLDGGQRVGVTDRLTEQWRFEADETGAAMSAQWLVLDAHNSLLSFGPSCDIVLNEPGCVFAAGFEHDSTRTGFGVDAQYATTHYTPVAAEQRAPPEHWQLFAHVQAIAPYGCSVTLASTWREELAGTHALNINMTAGKTWLRAGHVDFVLGRTSGRTASSYVTLIYTHSLDHDHTVSAQAYDNDSQPGGSIALQRSLPPGNGYGYLIQAADDSSRSLDARAQWNSDSLSLSGFAQQQGAHDSFAAEATGTLMWFGDQWLTARRVDRSFAILHAEGLPGLPVYVNEQLVATTDGNGTAVLPELRPFELNRVALDATTLPLAVDVSQLKFDVTPFRRGGAYIEVPVHLGASVRLTLDDQPVPVGARVYGEQTSTPVGNDGKAYVEGKAGLNSLRIEWQAGGCLAVLALPARPTADSDTVALACVAR